MKTFDKRFRSAVITAVAAILSFGAANGDVVANHPNSRELQKVFATPVPADFRPSSTSRADYLKLIAGTVDFFRQYQDERGAIIDPVSRGERQYSTPAFAMAAGLLVKEAGREDLLAPASKAFDHALTALVQGKAADSHADFYTPMLVHAYRSLKDRVSREQADTWADSFRKIVPEKLYSARLRTMNWNIVSSSGEYLRRHDGLVAGDQADRQLAYLDACMRGHSNVFKPIGMCADPGVPIAYDAYSRLWLENVFADDAYVGPEKEKLADFLRIGGLTTLLILSPSGEWATGGRSSMHNWADAQIVAICEMNATYWHGRGRPEVAGAFKRAAHRAYESVARWQRPSGEIDIMKNRAEPAVRFAFERYSNHSQFNLITMAILAMAYGRADESIAEAPMPSEVGGYVFDARETFHKIFAAAGGYYVEIDTAADGQYDATGLQRVHRAGVPLPALNDSSAPDRSYGDKAAQKAAVAVGVQWKAADGTWVGLADFVQPADGVKRAVTAADLRTITATPKNVEFEITYTLTGPDGDNRAVVERYRLGADGVGQTTRVRGVSGPLRLRVSVLVDNGATDTQVNLTGRTIAIRRDDSTTTVALPEGAGQWQLVGPKLVTHCGSVRAAVTTIEGEDVTLTVNLRRDKTSDP